MRRRLKRIGYRLFGLLPTDLSMRLVHAGATRYLAGVLCLVVRPDGRILVVKQPYREDWALPGGLLRKGETVVLALRREVREETGLEVVPRPHHRTHLGIEHRMITFRAVALVTDEVADSARPHRPEIDALDWVEPALTRLLGPDDLRAVEDAVLTADRTGQR